MRKTIIIVCFTLVSLIVAGKLFAQSSLSIEKIMMGERFSGFSPENIQWSPSGKTIYFKWNKDMENITPLYAFNIENSNQKKVEPEERKKLPSFNGKFNRNRTKMVYSKEGDLYLMETKSGVVTQISKTAAYESNPKFSHDEDKIVFTSGNNLFSWEI